ncbi:sine oculis-binding protein homolog [Pollicipes pollicipes]|uniref:sine oculis-binding protein homolog n=1 Tax=Pollicipes pollicipes TaxID=41117 RepID=UPI0018853A0F|nr:sine oculis-binding protein homolog [Pollicipes pollicipes]
MADARSLSTEPPEQDIQEFAETAMKEMLSWYGYERRDSPPPGRYERRGSPPPGAGGAGRLSRPSSPVTDGSMSPRAVSPVTAALANDAGCKRTPVVCSWCNKLGAQLYTMGSKAFCSEPCFSQSRAANFRKTKLCDWCKNIRDSLNIEYINGDQQLQFCSESCLNAYKMNIFCKETEAHIQMLPQLRELVSRSSKDSLITPDMWLRDRPLAGGVTTAGEVAPLSAAESGGAAPVDRRRLRRSRPDTQRAPLPPVTVLLPVPVAVPVPLPLPVPVPEDVCRELLARFQRREPPPPPPATAPADCPILKRELEKDSASSSDAEGLDLTVRKRKTDHPRKIKMEEDDFD